MKIALVTFDKCPDLDPDDYPFRSALEARGHEVDAVVWSDPHVDWSSYRAALVRSTWDYFLRHEEFLAWARRTETFTTLLHPAALLAWNSDKRYLRELEARGVATVPTAWFRAGDALHLDKTAAERGWPSLLVKPAISGNAFATLRVAADTQSRAAAQEALDALTPTRDFLVQPYLPNVEREGELSLVYFDGAFSHAVRKRPVAGDFRVQDTFGGVATAHAPTAKERALADSTLAAAASITGVAPLLYARVDLLYNEANEPLLIELEAIEPSLFFATAPGSELRLASALSNRLEATRTSS